MILAISTRKLFINKHTIMSTEQNLRCPVCGRGTVERTENGWACSNEACGFTLPHSLYDVELTEELVAQLLADGRTATIQMKNKDGSVFEGSFVLRGSRIIAQTNVHCLNTPCPKCGGRMRLTSKGYKCENALGEHPTCDFILPSIISNRRIAEEEAEQLLLHRFLALDGFATNEHKAFSSVVRLADDGKTVLDSRIARCPVCGGDIHIGQRAYNCANYRNEAAPCKFSIWRSIGGHTVTADEAREICEEGITKRTLEFYREDGVLYYKRLSLSPQKDRVNMI